MAIPATGMRAWEWYCQRGRSRVMTESPDDIRGQVESLREQATRCRRLARFTTDREIARRLLELAQDFEQRASELEAEKRCI
jgi:hypothetical protein